MIPLRIYGVIDAEGKLVSRFRTNKVGKFFERKSAAINACPTRCRVIEIDLTDVKGLVVHG